MSAMLAWATRSHLCCCVVYVRWRNPSYPTLGEAAPTGNKLHVTDAPEDSASLNTGAK
ncbi:hypothetical protein [Nostoc sp.]|uniref:hypothetical protein n=1 Tax=Nostoc sp. TaxID=1180 RepID=UPI002FFD0FE3